VKVLQISSDWKWTGPAEPMLRLALRQRERGFDVQLACPEPPAGAGRSLAGEAKLLGLPAAVSLARGRGVRPIGDRSDVARLSALLDRADVEIVHAWHTRDHVLALRAAAGRRRAGRSVLVRSYRNAERLAGTPWNRWLFGPGTDGLLCVSPATADANARLRGGRPVASAFGAVDTGHFAPGPADPTVRKELGLEAGHRVVGIVARVQPHRRFDLLLEAARRLFRRDPAARLVVVGRGTHRERLAEQPARRLGIADRVIFAGYRHHDYRQVLRAMDLFTFLVPGSDGTCRAVLEAAALGIPAVTSRRGALPEIVVDGETGLLTDEDPDALAEAWARLLADPERRARMGGRARQRAEALFTPEQLEEAVSQLYAAARRGRG